MTTYFWSATTRGFYLPEIHAEPPPDIVAIDEATHGALLDAQAAGLEIVAGPGGMPVAQEPPPPGVEALIRRAGDVIQHLLDETARQRRYDDMQAAVSYRGDANPVFAAEAEALFVWRSQVWTAAMALLAAVESGGSPVPSDEALLGALPAMVWPDTD